ncbi:lactosylceramide 4-alpha-galactosyltransferase-like [Tupaia chinensis]|uniref:lactosylceramide 4-alpha-galactosyltransferase-like n=1 Tax=Tupaia chinensis TaxID=246437 RepID=UPI000FFBDBF7|nr:lactosylceramide 4-alpha-galactosyltransferase-like [Tupaia chinensis]
MHMRPRGWIWSHQGPQLLMRVFKKWCSIHDLDKSQACHRDTILPHQTFYPRRASRTSALRICPGCSVPPTRSKGRTGRSRASGTTQSLLAQLQVLYSPRTHEAMKMNLSVFRLLERE